MTDNPKQANLGVFLFQLGAPNDRDEIQAFIRNLLSDVFPAPRFLRPLLAHIIAKHRAPRVQPLYDCIGGASPLLTNTKAQAEALATYLVKQGWQPKVYVCMRYAYPRVNEVLKRARQEVVNCPWVLLPLYPHYSFSTTRTSIKEFTQQLHFAEHKYIHTISSYAADPGYLNALKICIEDGLAEFRSDITSQNTHLLFSAHALPLKYIKQGDPYVKHVKQTVDGIIKCLSISYPHSLAFQSKLGPVAWIGPSLQQRLDELALQETENVLIIPISFVSEHFETLYELDIQMKNYARILGLQNVIRTRTPGTHSSFIHAMGKLVLDALSNQKNSQTVIT